jgi:uncharacterized protein YqgC (DUF456 family)
MGANAPAGLFATLSGYVLPIFEHTLAVLAQLCGVRRYGGAKTALWEKVSPTIILLFPRNLNAPDKVAVLLIQPHRHGLVVGALAP